MESYTPSPPMGEEGGGGGGGGGGGVYCTHLIGNILSVGRVYHMVYQQFIESVNTYCNTCAESRLECNHKFGCLSM